MIHLSDEQFKEYIESAHRAGQHNQGHCDPSVYEAMVYYEKYVKSDICIRPMSERFSIIEHKLYNSTVVILEIKDNLKGVYIKNIPNKEYAKELLGILNHQ